MITDDGIPANWDDQSMPISTDTIRTVIEIVPGWECDEYPTHNVVDRSHWIWPPWYDSATHNVGAYPEQHILDALAAAAVRVLLDKGFDVHIDIQGSHFEAPGMWIEITNMKLSERHEYEKDARFGVAENTLEAIAEFVRGGGFDAT